MVYGGFSAFVLPVSLQDGTLWLFKVAVEHHHF